MSFGTALRRVGRLRQIPWLIVSVLAGCDDRAPAPPVADTVFLGQFVTLDEQRPEVEALVVVDGTIIAAGTREAADEFVGDSTKVVEIPGIAVPGFVDAHVHISGLGGLLDQVNVQRLSKDEIIEAVERAAANAETGEWIVGRGWDEGFFASKEFPTAADLDSVTPDNPVILHRIDGHSAWVNSNALRNAGITAGSVDPEGGHIVRDEAGQPSGMLLERAVGLVVGVMPDTDSLQRREQQVRAALEQYSRWGLTSVHQAGADLAEIGIYKKLLAAGELPVRIYAMAGGGDAAVEYYLGTGPEIDLGDGRLSIRSFKIFVDGALGARGAELSEPYSDAPQTSGLSQLDDEQLDSFIRRAHAAGFQVNAHVIGDRAVERALDAFERAGITEENRFRLEHASIISPPNLPRFAEMGVVASMQPVFVGEYYRWSSDRVGEDRLPWIMPIRDLVATGAVLASGSDFPSSDSGDPRATLYALVTRKGSDGKPDGGWLSEQSVDVDTALKSMTSGGAYAAFQEDRLGELSPGFFADFTVLSVDPRIADHEELRTMEVLMTVMGGTVTHNANQGSGVGDEDLVAQITGFKGN